MKTHRRAVVLAAFAAALTVVLPHAAPALGSSFAGAPVELEGTLRAVHTDYFAQKRSEIAYQLVTRSRVLNLDVASLPRTVQPGSRVRVRGRLQGDTLAAAGGDVSTTSTSGTVASTGNRKTAVILLNFTTDTRQPWTVDQVRSAVFTGTNSVDAYFREQSFGRTSFTGKVRTDGDVYGWYTISNSRTSCDASGWSTAANSAAQSAGVDLSGYQHLVYIWPAQSSCAWAGMAYLPGTVSWSNGYISVGILGHELGHNLGVHHSGSLSCTNGSTRVTLSSSCTFSEYGDPFDVMGNIATRHMNTWHKARLGWYDGGRMLDVTTNGTHTLTPLETSSTGLQLLRVARGSSGDYFYLEYRRPFGFDSFLSTDPVVNGVSIRLGHGYNNATQSRLLDMNPSTNSFGDAALASGQTFTDGTYGISFRTASVSSSSAAVEVSFGSTPPPPPPPPPPPSDTTPPSAPTNLGGSVQSGPKVALGWTASTDDVGVAGYRVYRGGSQVGTSSTNAYTDLTVLAGLTYTYSVTAYDAAGNVSGASNSFTVTIPSGADTTPPSTPTNVRVTGRSTSSITIAWNESTDNVGVTGYGLYRNGTLLGTVGSSTLSVRYIYLTCGTTYTLGVHAQDAAGNRSSVASIQASTSACSGSDTTAPSAPSSLTAQAQSGPKVALSWTGSTDNVGVAGYRIYRGGTEIGTSTTTTYTDSAVTAGSTYSYTVRAYDAAGNLSSASNTATVTIPSGGDTSAPTAPTSLVAQVQTGPKVALTWTASTDNVGVAGYRIYRGGTQIGTSASTAYTDGSVSAGQTYTYTVRAVDAAGNLSAASNSVTVTIPSGGDVSPPTAPNNFRASGIMKTSLTLYWSESYDDVGVVGYGVYRNGTWLGNVSTLGAKLTYLTCGTTYTFGVDAYDAAGNRSPISSTTARTASLRARAAPDCRDRAGESTQEANTRPDDFRTMPPDTVRARS